MEDNANNDFIGMEICFLCGEPKGLRLDRRMRKTLPRSAAYDKVPCKKCQEFMQQGIIVISIRDGEPKSDNPYRTGGWWVIKEEAFKRFCVPGPLLDDVLKKRICFMEDTCCERVNLKKTKE